MTRRRAALALALACGGAGGAGACELLLSEQRGGRELLRVALPPAPHGFEIAFEHSVLGTTVVDRYEPRAGRAHLVEERFSGDGYGLPYAATAPGEALHRDGAGWRLELDRVVDPLVVRPLREQRMRLRAGGRELLLAELAGRAIELRPLGCAAAPR